MKGKEMKKVLMKLKCDKGKKYEVEDKILKREIV